MTKKLTELYISFAKHWKDEHKTLEMFVCGVFICLLLVYLKSQQQQQQQTVHMENERKKNDFEWKKLNEHM